MREDFIKSLEFIRDGSLDHFNIACDLEKIGDVVTNCVYPLSQQEISFIRPMSDSDCEDVEHAFIEYSRCTDAIFGSIIPLEDVSAESLRQIYCQLINGYYHLTVDDFDKAETLSGRCLDWLEKTDFFVAPASTKYHDDFEHGLLLHSLRVYNNVIDLLQTDHFSRSLNLREQYDALLAALVHDWCKIGLYEKYLKNVKNETTGKWEQQTAYRHKDTAIPLGHGTTSMFMSQKFFRLSIEQATAIRWHMGVYQVSETEKPDLFRANESMPMMFLLQFADQMSIVHF